MKIINTVVITLLVILALGYGAMEIFDLSIISNKNSENMSEQQDSEENTNPNAANLPAEITELAAQIIQEGTGEAQVQVGDKITVHYTGILTNGTKFDSSVDRGQPFSLTIGVGQVIPGWDQGVVGMKVGEIRRLFIPAQFAYGKAGVPGTIPPNSPLIFDIQLISIDESAEVEDMPAPQEDSEPEPEPEEEGVPEEETPPTEEPTE